MQLEANSVEAVLQFNSYDIREMIFKKSSKGIKEQFAETEIFSSIPNEIEDYSNIEIRIGVKIGDENFDNSEMYLSVLIAGHFSINLESEQEVSDETISSLLKVNSVAILFPYLRMLVSDISSRGNNQPIILPTINVQKLMTDNQ